MAGKTFFINQLVEKIEMFTDIKDKGEKIIIIFSYNNDSSVER